MKLFLIWSPPFLSRLFGRALSRCDSRESKKRIIIATSSSRGTLRTTLVGVRLSALNETGWWPRLRAFRKTLGVASRWGEGEGTSGKSPGEECAGSGCQRPRSTAAPLPSYTLADEDAEPNILGNRPSRKSPLHRSPKFGVIFLQNRELWLRVRVSLVVVRLPSF